MSDGNSNVGTVMSPWEAWCDRTKWTLIRFRRRWVPYLVWWGQEIDVCITFSEDKLPQTKFGDVRINVDANDSVNPDLEALRPLFSGAFAEIERTFTKMGITFDKGMGFDGRDWEWDYSLEGPIHIKFKGRAQKPWRRRERPRPTLVVKRPGAA